MKKILPVNLNACIKTECWTYMRMCIIQTLENYEKWLYTHLTTFVDCNTRVVYFGDYIRVHPADYYNDILFTEEINIFSISSEDIVKYIKINIDDGFYMSVFVNDDNDYNHEVFIYGYDDDNNGFDSIALNNEGGFKPLTVDYRYIETGYKKLIEYYKAKPNEIFSRRPYNYLLSRIKSSKSYLTRDYTPDYFKKISHEVYGTIHRLIYTDEHENPLEPFDFHTGLTCLLAMKNRITSGMQIADEETKQKNVYQARNSMFKLLEHRRIIYNGMEWYESEWQIDLTELKNAKRQYSDCLTYMEQTCMMILKYDVMQEQVHFNKIIGRLSEQYKNEKQSLQEYFKHIQEWYYKHICAY